MNPEDDPEARIRQLEQPLANHGAVELGATQPGQSANATAPMPSPVYGSPTDPSLPYQQSPYQQSPYSAPPIGLLFGLIAVVVIAIVGGIAAAVWSGVSRTTDVLHTLPSSLPTIEARTMPPMPAPTGQPSAPRRSR